MPKGLEMIIIGDELIPFEKIEKITTKKDIKSTSSNATVVFGYDKEILKYCMDNDIRSAIKISSIKESVICNALGAKYIIVPNELLEDVQKLAENYMFDAKILAVIECEDEIESVALKGIDGVIYSNLVINETVINSVSSHLK